METGVFLGVGASVGMSSLLKTDFLNLNVIFKSLQNIKLCLLELMAVYAVSQWGFFNNQSVQWECGCPDLYPLPQVFANSAPREIGYNYKPLQTSLVGVRCHQINTLFVNVQLMLGRLAVRGHMV